MKLDTHTTITVFPRMEQPWRWERISIPLGDGWTDAVTTVIEATLIPPADAREHRRTRSGPLQAKACAPGVTAYVLDPGGRRRKADVLARDEWTWLPIDLDAVPLTVSEVGHIVSEAFGTMKHIAWSTWSCRDGYASVRVMIPLAHAVKQEQLIPAWWWARTRLIEAGLPEASAKDGEPANDSRALDGRLFYLPSAPTPGADPEGWGGTNPKALIAGDDVPVLDPFAILGEGRRLRQLHEADHLARWPVPVPGRRATSTSPGREAFRELDITAERRPSGVVAKQHLAREAWPDEVVAAVDAGHDRLDGCPWCGSTSKRVLSVGRTSSGRLLAYCFSERVTRVQQHDRDLGSEDFDAYLDSIGIGIGTGEPEPENDDPGRPVWMRDTGDPLIDEANRIARRLEYRRDGTPIRAEADAVAEALRDLAGRSNTENGPIPHGGYLREDQDTRGEVSEEKHGSSEDDLSDEEIDAAVEHYARMGGSPIFCSRGQKVTIASGGPSAVTTRMPCKGYGCTVCAPRKLIALQAAATVILGDEGIGAGWETVVFDCPSSGKTWDKIRHQLSSWASVRDRHHLIYGVRPGTNRVHVIYRAGDEPRTRTALHRTFIHTDATYEVDVVAAVVDTIGRIDLTAWANHEGRKHIDRGRSNTQAKITALHKQVIGAAASKLTAAERRRRRETRVVLTLNETVDAIRFAAEKAMGGVRTEADTVAVDVRSRQAFTRWRFEDHEVDARIALQRVKDTLPPREVRAQVAADDAETDADPISTLDLFGCDGPHGFIDLDMRKTG